MTENKVNGQKYRVAKDAANDVWNVLSFETAASDVKFNDGKTGEDKAQDLAAATSRLNTLTSEFNTLTSDVTEIKKVSALPPDAASHPNTLYLITD